MNAISNLFVGINKFNIFVNKFQRLKCISNNPVFLGLF